MFMVTSDVVGLARLQIARQLRALAAYGLHAPRAMANPFWWKRNMDARGEIEPLFELSPRWHRLFLRLLAFTPPVEIVESDDAHVLVFDIPGVSPADVDVRLEAHRILVVSGRRHPRMRARYSERRHGAFSRAIELPPDADGKNLEASFHDGVLEITVPKLVATRRTPVSVRNRSPVAGIASA